MNWSDALQNAEQEMWEEIVANDPPAEAQRASETDNRCDNCGQEAELFHNEASGLAFCEACDTGSWDSEAASDDGDSSEAAAEVLDGTVSCDGCSGDGIYRRGYYENGVFKGFEGTCFRCGGKGRQTESDVKRNWGYDLHRTVSL